MITLGHILIIEISPSFSSQNSSIEIPLLTAHILMFSFILSEVVRFSSQLYYYRKGNEMLNSINEKSRNLKFHDAQLTTVDIFASSISRTSERYYHHLSGY
jgi:hypothetical protein